jgi:hypothetical protein
MNTQSDTFPILRHALAGVISAGFLIVVAVATFFICAAINDDVGGPMVPFLIPLLAVIGGIGTSLIVYFPLSILFGWLSREVRVSFWIILLMFFALVFLFFLGWGVVALKRLPSFSESGLAALGGLFFTSGFTIYWSVLAIGRRKFGRQKDAA